MQTLSGQLDNQKRLIFAITQFDEIGVGRIIRTALRNSAGVETIVDQLARAAKGAFSPRLYSVSLQLYD
jgi:hypothetical protein